MTGNTDVNANSLETRDKQGRLWKLNVHVKQQGEHGLTSPQIVYLDGTDTLVVAEEGSDMRHINRVFICKNYLAGNRETVSFVPGAGAETGCVAAVGDSTCLPAGGRSAEKSG